MCFFDLAEFLSVGWQRKMSRRIIENESLIKLCYFILCDDLRRMAIQMDIIGDRFDYSIVGGLNYYFNHLLPRNAMA